MEREREWVSEGDLERKGKEGRGERTRGEQEMKRYRLINSIIYLQASEGVVKKLAKLIPHDSEVSQFILAPS